MTLSLSNIFGTYWARTLIDSVSTLGQLVVDLSPRFMLKYKVNLSKNRSVKLASVSDWLVVDYSPRFMLKYKVWDFVNAVPKSISKSI
jgi:hypothetical protein